MCLNIKLPVNTFHSEFITAAIRAKAFENGEAWPWLAAIDWQSKISEHVKLQYCESYEGR